MPRRKSGEEIDALFARQRAGDPVGLGIHVLLAAGACFMAGWSTTFVDWAALGVLICFFIRMTTWHAVLEPLAFDRALRLLLAWGAWLGLSAFWSAARNDPATAHEWMHDVQTLRFLPLGILIWPVMDRRGWLIAAVMAGIACGQVSQVVHLATETMHTTWQPWHRAPGRISGWWDPAVSGSLLCAGLGLWLSAAILARGMAGRCVGLAGVCATLVCITLTGTRGAWIGAAMLMVITGTIAAWRIRPRTRLVMPVAVAGVVCVLGAGIAYVVAGAQIRDRLNRGVQEVRGVFESDNYSTDTGMRIAMWRWAIREFEEHPVIGVGAGGYRPWSTQANEARERESRAKPGLGAGAEQALLPGPHAHAHSWMLHTMATLGIVGTGILGALIICAIAAGLKSPHRLSSKQDIRWHEYGPSLALIGLVCVGLFDSITINQQTSYLFYLLVGLCLPSRPREAGLTSAEGAAT